MMYSGSATDLMNSNDKWLFCDGSAVSRSTYEALFRVIGTSYGSGNGIDTFNLPDLRSRFPWGSISPSNTSLPSGGNDSLTLTTAQLPAHTHTQGTLTTATSGSHSHSYTDPGHSHSGSASYSAPSSSRVRVPSGSSYYVYYTGTHTHSITIGSSTSGISISSAGSHTHTISGSTGSEGLGQTIDKMPPYQTVHYIIRT